MLNFFTPLFGMCSQPGCPFRVHRGGGFLFPGGFDEDDHEGRCRGSSSRRHHCGGCGICECRSACQFGFSRSRGLPGALLWPAALLRLRPLRLSEACVLLCPPALSILVGAEGAQVVSDTAPPPLVKKARAHSDVPAHTEIARLVPACAFDGTILPPRINRLEENAYLRRPE